jgi:protein AFG1
MKSPLSIYQALIKSKKIIPDAHQIKTIELLQKLFVDLQSYKPPLLINIDQVKKFHTQQNEMLSPDFAWIKQSEASLIDKLGNALSFRQKSITPAIKTGPKGLYLYGSVGTGKTMIMDMFYNSLDIDRKRRCHFHQFMQDVHKRIHIIRKDKNATDPIPTIADELTNAAWLVCFDEMQVTDITDVFIESHV